MPRSLSDIRNRIRGLEAGHSSTERSKSTSKATDRSVGSTRVAGLCPASGQRPDPHFAGVHFNSCGFWSRLMPLLLGGLYGTEHSGCDGSESFDGFGFVGRVADCLWHGGGWVAIVCRGGG